MIHVNVRPYRKGKEQGKGVVVETSTDGAGWKTQYLFEAQSNLPGEAYRTPGGDKQEAENTARIMGVAWSYAGVEWRGTSHGYGL